MAGLGPWTAAGHDGQDFGPGVTAEPDNIWAIKDAGGWLKARKTKFTGAVQKDDFHMGLDIVCAEGTPALAPETGIVRTNFFDEFRAKCTVVEIRPGTVFFHGHLSKWGRDPGERVLRGRRVGLTGCTGKCFGAHDHVMVYHSGVDTDWRNWFRWYAFNPARLAVGGDMAGVGWIRPR